MIREENLPLPEKRAGVQSHLFEEALSSEDGAYCPHCRDIALFPPILHGGVYRCPKCREHFSVKVESASVYTTRKWQRGCDGCNN